ncbi:MAG TPA: hypothetical protein VKB19_02765 [Pedobacter sp.]|nr:hypothetical protein [Pedobacter sp.]
MRFDLANFFFFSFSWCLFEQLGRGELIFHFLFVHWHRGFWLLCVMKLNNLNLLKSEVLLCSRADAMAGSGELTETLTKAQAFRLYSRGAVEGWLSEGLIHACRLNCGGSKKSIDRLKLEAVARASKRSGDLQAGSRKV